MDVKRVEIVCTACGADTLVRREPKYDGFKKVGEILTCTACGHEFASEEDVPFKQKRKAEVFSEADRSRKIEVFSEDDKGRTCRLCGHYVVNPFTQRCGLNHRIVQATDSCVKFEEKKSPPAPSGTTPDPAAP